MLTCFKVKGKTKRSHTKRLSQPLYIRGIKSCKCNTASTGPTRSPARGHSRRPAQGGAGSTQLRYGLPSRHRAPQYRVLYLWAEVREVCVNAFYFFSPLPSRTSIVEAFYAATLLVTVDASERAVLCAPGEARPPPAPCSPLRRVCAERVVIPAHRRQQRLQAHATPLTQRQRSAAGQPRLERRVRVQVRVRHSLPHLVVARAQKPQ